MLMLKSTHRAEMAAKDEEIAGLETARDRETARCNRITERWVQAQRERDAAVAELTEARLALSNICAMQTPNSAHIGAKMATRARKALPDECASSVRIGDSSGFVAPESVQ